MTGLTGSRPSGCSAAIAPSGFSLDPYAGEAYITLHAGGHEITSVDRLRGIERLTIVKRDGREGLELKFTSDKHDPLTLQTRPEIRLYWQVAPLGTR